MSYIALFTVQKALPLLRDGSAIVLTASTTSVSGTPAFSVYSATKAAIRSFARNWILDLKVRQIRVNAISSGVSDTAGLNDLFGNQAEGTKAYVGSHSRWQGWSSRRNRQGGSLPGIRRRQLRQR
ncbi:SDR family oxidoreductase [Asticcacaulis sp. YBE204]|uniref:SDR family oxidoreductase n=1 Tax=Asticcacaulis sp. YBE204 TaxID=1282363 RepID=UPI002100F9D1|nr:SDR family oxidoreductase [Asticcacaulis sp. YBE204]